MAVAEGFTGVGEGFMAVAVALAAAGMDGAVAATAGVVVTGAAGTVEGMGVVGTEAVGMVAAGIGAVVPTGGVTRTPMLTDLTVGKRTVGMSSCSSGVVGLVTLTLGRPNLSIAPGKRTRMSGSSSLPLEDEYWNRPTFRSG